MLDVMLKSNLMKNILYYMLEHPKALSTHHSYDSENLKDRTMGNQQETNKITNKKTKLKQNKLETSKSILSYLLNLPPFFNKQTKKQIKVNIIKEGVTIIVMPFRRYYYTIQKKNI
jgi:hypothetical protein